jgi:hypothetical protein
VTRSWPAWLPFLALYLAVAVGLFLITRDHAYHPTDDGFILAYSWRITQGEIPYRDFIFERPPLTLYLHIGWLALPEGWQIPAGRLAFYMELAASCFLMTAWAVSRGLRANAATLAVTGGTFLIALHTFPPMPWVTVDGVFFAGAGIASFLTWRGGRSARWLALSVAALALGSLAKQSFAPLLGVVVAYGLVSSVRARDGRVAAAAIAPPSLIAGAFIVALIATSALEPFLYQIAQPLQMRPSATNPWTGDLVAIGVMPYLTSLAPGFVPLFALATIAFLVRDQARAAAVRLPITLALLFLAALFIPTRPFSSGFVVFYGAATIAIADAIRVGGGRSSAVPLVAYVLALLAGWCASLSFAYLTPILAVGLLGPLAALTAGRRPTRFDTVLAAATLATIAAVVIVSNVVLPYRDTPRDQQTADLGEIYPRLGHVYTNPSNAARHRELRDLSTRFALDRGRSFVVFNAFPLAHFLSASRSPVSVDWLEPQEYVGNEDRLQRELESSQPVLIIQRQEAETVGGGSAPLSCAEAAASAPAFAAGLLARALVFEATYFCVYTP